MLWNMVITKHICSSHEAREPLEPLDETLILLGQQQLYCTQVSNYGAPPFTSYLRVLQMKDLVSIHPTAMNFDIPSKALLSPQAVFDARRKLYASDVH